LLFFVPVEGPATAGPGVTGKLGVITRSGGMMQATYDGHPLYTYVGDSTAHQAKANASKHAGGKWYEMTVSGLIPSATSGGGSGH
jgi:hypothetical protein